MNKFGRMNKKPKSLRSISQTMVRIWFHLAKKFRIKFFLLLFLAVIASFAEVISIGALIPFIGAITNPDQLLQNQHLAIVLDALTIKEAPQVFLLTAFLFCLAAIFAGYMRIKLLQAQINLNNSVALEFSVQIFTRTLYQPYSLHIKRNSSEVISALTHKAGTLIGSGINPVSTVFSSAIIIISILIGLLYINPLVAICSTLGFSIIYIGISFFSKRKLSENSKIINDSNAKVIQVMQEGIGGVRDVILDRSQQEYIATYQSLEIAMRNATASVQLISASPRYLIETFGMLLIAILAYLMATNSSNSENIVPILGILALSAQRMLPLLQQIYASWAAIVSGKDSVSDALDFLDQPMPLEDIGAIQRPIKFVDKITLNNVSFRYSENQPWILRNINLSFNKGEMIGFIGTTGSGKSTLMDLVMGLLIPEEGCLEIDNIKITQNSISLWQKNIAHVPQSIFLTDATILRNIAFGIPEEEIDISRVIWATKLAQIHDDIESWPLGYGSYAGERGVRLSGGQRQRIGIARALYKKSEVIVLDEATSALDALTESKIMLSLTELTNAPTILMIAHRLSTLKKCARILQVERGCIINDGSFKNIVEHHSYLKGLA